MLAVMAAPVPAVAAPSLLLIQDGSGSMWGRVDGEPKIVTAKQVLQNLVAEAPDGIELGLMVYGHRRKGDCADIELMAPLASDHQAIAEAIERVMPKGKTPISDALQSAGGLLAGREDRSTIALVSDGIETCDGDPCAVAKSLRAQGHDLVIHVVGFDVDGDAQDQLECIARAGGGRYFAADDAAALSDALVRVQQSVAEATQLPEPATAPEPVPVTSSSKRIRIPGPGRVELAPAEWVQMPPYRWSLEDAETGEMRFSTREPGARVKAGEYRVVWRQTEHGHSDVPIDAVVRVESGETVQVPLDTGLQLSVPAGFEPPYVWALVPEGEEEPIASFRETLEPQLVPAGRYRLRWHQDQHRSRPVDLGPIEIEAGRLNAVALDAGLVLQPAAWLGERAPEGYGLLAEDAETIAYWSLLGPQLAPAGRYRLVYRPTEHHHSDIPWGEVVIGETGLTAIPLDSGIGFIVSDEIEPPYRVYFVDLDSETEMMMQETWDPMPLPPGRYRMDWWESQHGSRRETLIDELVVEPGTLLEMEL
jgi:Ca-activated chloride channel family protein